MDKNRKIILAAIFVVGLIAIVLFEKQSTFNKSAQTSVIRESSNTSAQDTVRQGPLPDLGAELQIEMPQEPNGNIIADFTVINNGPGIIPGDKAFRYALYLDDQKVLDNVDAYTSMNPGDSFNFRYEIDRDVYPYQDTGFVKAVVDLDDNIQETTVENNVQISRYKF